MSGAWHGVATSIHKEAIREYAPFYNAKKNIQII